MPHTLVRGHMRFDQEEYEKKAELESKISSLEAELEELRKELAITKEAEEEFERKNSKLVNRMQLVGNRRAKRDAIAVPPKRTYSHWVKNMSPEHGDTTPKTAYRYSRGTRGITTRMKPLTDQDHSDPGRNQRLTARAPCGPPSSPWLSASGRDATPGGAPPLRLALASGPKR